MTRLQDNRVRGRRRGLTFVELLAAALILAVGLFAMLNVWLFGWRMTEASDEEAVACSLGRSHMEQIHRDGFAWTQGGVENHYYTRTGAAADPAEGYFRVAVVKTRSAGFVAHVRSTEVVIAVERVADGAVLYQTRTHLALGGA